MIISRCRSAQLIECVYRYLEIPGTVTKGFSMTAPNQIIILDDAATPYAWVKPLEARMREHEEVLPEVNRLPGAAVEMILNWRRVVCAEWGTRSYLELADKLSELHFFDDKGARREVESYAKRAFLADYPVDLDQVAYAIVAGGAKGIPVRQELWGLMNDIDALGLAKCVLVHEQDEGFEYVSVSSGERMNLNA